MEYSEEFLNKIEQCGILSYAPSKIINILDITDTDAFIQDFINKDSIIYQTYKKGNDKADYIIDIKWFDLVQNGNIQAIKELAVRRNQQKESLKSELEKINYDKIHKI